jgi:hypothetical protein
MAQWVMAKRASINQDCVRVALCFLFANSEIPLLESSLFTFLIFKSTPNLWEAMAMRLPSNGLGFDRGVCDHLLTDTNLFREGQYLDSGNQRSAHPRFDAKR